MVLKIKLENFFSIKEKIVIDFIAGNTKSAFAEKLSDNIFEIKDAKVIKTIGLFGQNASGKSNILKALTFCVDLINNSQLYSDTTTLQYTPYKFDNYSDKPSTFFIDFMMDDVEYEYSFSLMHNSIIKESLYYYPNHRRAKVFERDETSDEPVYSFGGNVIKRANDIIASTGKQNLFLSRASSMNRELAQDLCKYFKENIVLRLDGFDENQLKNHFTKYKDLILETLSLCDSDITNIELDFEKLDTLNRPVFTTYHNNNNDVPFDMAREESDGTNNLFRILLRLIDVIENGKLIFLDEFDNSLHTFLADFVINLIHASNNAQMIYTSHNTNLIDVKKLRKDQILFVNKKDNSYTEVYSLFDFKDFRETMDAEKGYLQGRFEAVPDAEVSVESLKKLLRK